MTFSDEMLSHPRPDRIDAVSLPVRNVFRIENGREIPYFPSPVDWAGEVLYFLLPDRFSDGRDAQRAVIDRSQPFSASRPAGFRWDQWAESGRSRWQGGTIAGMTSRLDYLAQLGITAVWVGPLFKQRRHADTYHGYAIQDFLEVDPHFGTRQDLVEFVQAAHARNIRVILDVIFNHSGYNWEYQDPAADETCRAWPNYWEKGPWIDGNGQPAPGAAAPDAETGVWPRELQADQCYTRAGWGGLGGEEIDDPHAPMRRSDFAGRLRDFNTDHPVTLDILIRCYQYWIALTDADGMRIDTLKHVPFEVARNFCGAIKEFGASLGKRDFLLIGEVGGPDSNAGRYLDVLELNLNMTLDIGESLVMLNNAAKGREAPGGYLHLTNAWAPLLGSHRNSAQRHVKILDDHDHIFGPKLRFCADAANAQQAAAAVALQLFTLGIPCIYYGTEQALPGPEPGERQWVPDFGAQDAYLRETMFGAAHPRRSGAQGLLPGEAGEDLDLPGFGASGAAGRHFFDKEFHVFKRIRDLIRIRKACPALSYGRQYERAIRNFSAPFADPPAGELIAWSRLLAAVEILCVVNGNGEGFRGGDVTVDLPLNSAPGSEFTVLLNTAQRAAGAAYGGRHPAGDRLAVQYEDGRAYVSIRDVGPSETLVLGNRPDLL